ncbi:MAG: hypothetical protein FJ012_01150 [Chloroflexi bacterium]|nr:hypothetical protein [Chloroflexota bacterium]
MQTKVVGILERRDDRFMADVASRLADIPVEYISFADERVPLERPYRVVVDRLSFCYPFLREMVKNLALGGAYVINNPFAAAATNKLVDMRLGSCLGLAFPKTIVLPDQTAIEQMSSVVAQPDLDRVDEELGFPCVLKPFDGYAWQDVYMVSSVQELRNLYLALCSRYVLMAQQLITFKDYFRVFCFDKKDVLFVRWVPKPLAMGQYLYCDLGGMGGVLERLIDLTTRFNQALDLDVNVMEWCVDEKGQWWVIDAFNEVPDITPEALPREYYTWIVERFAACVRDKLDPSKKNRTPFAEPSLIPGGATP